MSLYHNPFDFEKPVKNPTYFAGREKELKDIDYYIQMMNSSPPSYHNLSIIGKRASGKTSLLYMIKDMAVKNNLLPVVISLDNDSSSNEILFFKELFDTLIGESVKRDLFGGIKGTLWRSYRKLVDTLDLSVEIPFEFGTAYVGAKKNNLKTLSQHVMKTDLIDFYQRVKNEKINGIILLIDECDLLATNQTLLQKIRHVFSEIDGYMLVFSGTEKMFPSMNDVFSPLPRMFRRISLDNFTNVQETKQSIIKRLAEDEQKLISDQTIQEIHQLTNGDPYEIQLISHFVYKNFKESNLPRIELNTNVLEDVMNELDRLRSNSSQITTFIKNCPTHLLSVLKSYNACQNSTPDELATYMTLSKISELKIEDIINNKKSNLFNISFISEKLFLIENSRLKFKGNSFDFLYLKYHLLSSGIGKDLMISDNPALGFFYILTDIFVVGIDYYKFYVVHDRTFNSNIGFDNKKQFFNVGGNFKVEKQTPDGKSVFTIFDPSKDQNDFYLGVDNSIRFRINLNFLNTGFVVQYKFYKSTDVSLVKTRLSELKLKFELLGIDLVEKDEVEITAEGRKYVDEKNFLSALTCFENAIKVNPDFELVWANKGMMHFQNKEYHKALNSFEKWSEIRPSLSDPLEHIGKCYIMLGNFDKGFEFLDKASKISPDIWSIWDNRGRALLNLQQYENAIISFDKAISLKSDDYDAVYFKGYCLFRLKQNKEALEIFNSVHSFILDKTEVLLLKAQCLYDLGNYSECLDFINSLKNTTNYSKAELDYLILESIILDKLGRTKESLAICNQILNLDQTNIINLVNKACFEVKSGNTSNAIADLKSAFVLDKPKTVSLIQNEPDLDSLKDNPEFIELLKD